MLTRLIVLVAGIVLMATEILAFRIVGRTFGTALRETTAVITVFLAAMSLGYWIGGRLGDRYPRFWTLVIPLAFAAVWLGILPFFDRAISEAVATSSLPLATHALAVNLLLFFIPVALLAAISPIAIRILTRDIQTTGSVAGSTAALSAVGSILGTIFAGFYLIGRFPISHILRGMALALIVLAVFTILWRSWTASRRRGIFSLLLGAALLSAADTKAAARVLYEWDSAYHHILVEDHGRYRYLFFDDTRQSRMLLDDPVEGGFEYTRFFHAAWLFNPSIESVLFIGLGGGTGPKQFLHDYPRVHVWVSEVDPAIIRIAKEYFGLQEDERLTLRAIDGRLALRRMSGPVDVIVVDAYSSGRYGATVPFHLTTDEFFKLVAERLTDDGVVLYNAIGKPSDHDDEFARALAKTMKLTFPDLYVFECDDSRNSVLVGLKRAQGLSLRDIVRRAEELTDSGLLKRKDYARDALGLFDGEFDTDDVPVLTDDYAPVDRLLRD